MRSNFLEYVQQMPKYVFTVCHRRMFQKDVKVCNRVKYKIKFNANIWSSIMTCFSGIYIDKNEFKSCKRIEYNGFAQRVLIFFGKEIYSTKICYSMLAGYVLDKIRILNNLERRLKL